MLVLVSPPQTKAWLYSVCGAGGGGGQINLGPRFKINSIRVGFPGSESQVKGFRL